MSSQPNVLVIGGNGYVGVELVNKLLKNNYKVTSYDLMIYGNNLIEDPNLINIKGDIRNIDMLDSHIKGKDLVIHLACISNDPSFELNPKLGKDINLDSFLPIVNSCKKNKIKRFIYASSSSVYGVKSEKNVDELLKLEPLTDYSKYKAECEKLLLDNHSSIFTPVVLRPATVCGFSKRQRLDVIVNIFTNLAFHKNEISIFGGNQLRPNIHIKDMVDSYLKVIEAESSLIDLEIFNVGNINQSVSDIASIVKNNINKKVFLKKIETDDNRSYHISSKKFINKLDFEFKYNIKDAIKDLVYAFENNLLVDTLSNDNYFNIKKMQNIKLK